VQSRGTDTRERLWVPKVQALRRDAVDAVIRYLGPMHVTKDTPPLSENPAIILRDSMLYRAESIGFHTDLLKAHFSRFNQEAVVRYRAAPGNPLFLLQCRNVLTFLSDDVLFNSLSMLDYVGNLVGCTVSGPDSQKWKWNGAAKAALDKQHKLSATEAGKLLASLHKEWIDRLHGVRSQIIHERVTLGDGGQTITIGEGDLVATLAFQLPPRVVKRLKFLQAICDDKERVDIVAGSELIGLRAIDAAGSIMAALLQDMGGRLGDSQR
jgi:hypothetical protein